MKIWRPKKLLPPAATAVMFVAAMALLLFGSVEGTRAALTYYSETYASRVQMYDIGVSLLENGERVSWKRRCLLERLQQLGRRDLG